MTVQLEYTIEVLEETPARVARFLQGIGAVPVIRTVLAQAGMTATDLTEGRTLLMECLAEPTPAPINADTAEAKASRAAASEIDQWDEPNFQRYSASLKRHFRSAHDYVFDDLKASQGPAAVKGVALFLTRVKALGEGSDPARGSTKDADAKAVALLAARGLTAVEHARLQGLVDLALGPTSALTAAAQEPPSDERLTKLSKLRSWFDEWSSTARAVVKKRSYLIRLGLAKRKASGAADDGGDGIGTPPATPPK